MATLSLGACSSGVSPAGDAPAPLAVATAAVTASSESAPTTEEAIQEASQEGGKAASAVDVKPVDAALKVAVDTFMSGLPNDYMAMGRMEDVKAAIESGVYLIDVREPSEYAAGHIAGAVNIPLRTVAKNLDKIPSDQPVLVYCASSLRTSTATAALRLLGYDNVKSYPGGCTGLVDAGEATETEPTAAPTFAPRGVDAHTLAAVDALLSSLPDGYYAVDSVERLQEDTANGAVLIDVRETTEYADGAIPGAVNIPIRTLAKSLAQIPHDKPVIIYCASGHRAAVGSAMLHLLGYENVLAFPGGYGAWEAAQGEVGDQQTAMADTASSAGADSEVVATVQEFLNGLPDNFRSVGNLEAFEEAVSSAQPLLIDVRETEEYGEGHIAGAINIPLRELADNLDKVPSDRPVIVYCASGHRSGLGAAALAMLGYGNVRAFPGGWHVWREAGKPGVTELTVAESVTPKEVDAKVLATVGAFLHSMPEGYLAVGDVQQLKAAIAQGAAVIDVREEAELAEGQIAGATNLPLRTLADHLDQVPTDRSVVVYCASGHRAAMATAALRVMGYENVYAFPAGYGVWQAAGEATE
jgi:rhodanese-related sulfurtransferase